MPKFHRRGAGDLPPVQILPHGLALALLEQAVIKPRRVPVEVQQPRPAAGRVPVAVLLRDLHPGALGQKPHRVGEGEVLLLHDEVHHAAALFAAEAVEDLLVGGDGEGGGLLTVKGTQAEEVRALPRELDIAAHHIHDVAASDELVQKALGKCHGPPPSYESFAGKRAIDTARHGNQNYIYPKSPGFPSFFKKIF
jgi:hypothetical protein